MTEAFDYSNMAATADNTNAQRCSAADMFLNDEISANIA